MDRLLLAAALGVLAVVVAALLRRRRPSPPSQPRWQVPAQLDRHDFDTGAHGRGRPWLVAVFTSSTCASCARATEQAAALEGPEVSYVELPYQSRCDLHDRYHIEAVPTTVLAGADGVVRASFVGVADEGALAAALEAARADAGG